MGLAGPLYARQRGATEKAIQHIGLRPSDKMGNFIRDVGPLRAHIVAPLRASAPASGFSKMADTGIRVPLKTHAPPASPAMLSTAEHCDHSGAVSGLPELASRLSFANAGRTKPCR